MGSFPKGGTVAFLGVPGNSLNGKLFFLVVFLAE